MIEGFTNLSYQQLKFQVLPIVPSVEESVFKHPPTMVKVKKVGIKHSNDKICTHTNTHSYACNRPYHYLCIERLFLITLGTYVNVFTLMVKILFRTES